MTQFKLDPDFVKTIILIKIHADKWKNITKNESTIENVGIAAALDDLNIRDVSIINFIHEVVDDSKFVSVMGYKFVNRRIPFCSHFVNGYFKDNAFDEKVSV